jgi:Xaa-Pro dipeptidase
MRRRDLLLLLGLSACAPVLPPRARRRVRTTPATHHEVRSEYPPLPPLPDSVYTQRREAARRLLREARAQFLFTTSGATNFAYLVGSDFGKSERLIALVLPGDGEPLLLCPAFEAERVRRGARGLAVVGWQESEDPFARVSAWVGDRKRASWLVDPRSEYGMAAKLAAAQPEAKLASAGALFETLRVKKSSDELSRMRRATVITEDAFAATFDRLEVGMSEAAVARVVAGEHERRGVEGYALVQFGASAALPHGGPTAAPLADGTLVLMDGGCTFQGWWSDVTRVRWFGDQPPPERVRTLYNLVHDAQTAALARVRPGVAAQEIDRAARAVIAQAGFGANFTHRLGHGMGMEGHEPVYLVEGNATPLAPGHVFSVEPGIYLPGEVGVRLEEDVVCGEDGPELLSRRPPRL